MRFSKQHDPDATRPNTTVDPQDDVWEAPVVDTLPTQPHIAAKLDRAKEATQLGQRQRAYRLSQEVTQLDPNNIEAWLYRAALAESGEERLAYLNKVLSLAPRHAGAKRGLYETLRLYLEQNPFLRYLEEDEALYQVLTGEGRAIIVPKDRAVAPTYPPLKPTPLQPVYRWLGYALLGLPLAGLPTVVCAVVAIALLPRAVQKPLTARELRRALVALLGASILGAMGLALSFLFLLHV
jgi:hypothetical protein